MSSTDDAYAMVLDGLTMKSGPNAILRDISLAVESRKLFGILGESGAGKSTLLRLIARKLDESTLTIEGHGRLPTEIWFIAQENVLYEYDTPIHVVTFLHQMLYSSTTAEAEKVAVELLERVHFPMEVLHEPVGSPDKGLSVGSRRLLNVALALCAQSKVILLDEPTTGIDSTTARNLVSVLRDICREINVTCICTIHQPSDEALACFDDVLVMSEGRAFVAPHGTSEGATQSKEDVPDDLSRAEQLLVLMKHRKLPESTLPAFTEAYREANCKELLADQLARLPPSKAASFATQCVLLTKRAALRQWYNVFALKFRFFVSLFLAVLVGIAFWKLPYDDPTYLRDFLGFFLIITGMSFVPIIISSGFFPGEQPSFLHEMGQTQRYQLLAFILGRTLVDMAIALISSVSVFIMVGMVGIKHEVGRFWFSLLLQAFSSDSFGFLLSTLVRPEVSISALIPSVGFISVLVGTGLASPPRDENSGWIFHVIKWGSFFKYGFAATSVDQISHITGTCVRGVDAGCAFTDSDETLSYLRLHIHEFVGKYGFQWILLVIFHVGMRVLASLRLYFLVKGNKFSYAVATQWSDQSKKAPATITPTASVTPAAHEPVEPDNHAAVTIDTNAEEDVPLSSPQMEREASFISDLKNAKEHPSSLRWRDSRIVVQDDPLFGKSSKRTILHGASGIALSGEVLAILGPAHCGKSLLMSALSRQIPIIGVNKEESALCIRCFFHKDNIAVEERESYRLVYQFDAFVAGDTVTEAIDRQLQLCGLSGPEEHAQERESILKSMALSHVAQKRVTDISGGQLRRLSIACQLAHRPHVFLLDEPTSGLDSELAYDVMKTLQRYARASNTIVICTLNQPGKRILPCVDQFLFMAGGQTVFHGSLAESLSHFGVTDAADRTPTDIILDKLQEEKFTLQEPDAITAGIGAPMPTTVRTKPFPSHRTKPLGAFGTFCREVAILVKRNATSRLASPAIYVLELLVKFTFFPLFIGILFINVHDPTYLNRTGVFFLVNAAFSFIAMITPIVLFNLEATVFTRDTRARDYSPISYTIARWIFELPGEVLSITAGTAIVYGLVQFKINFGLLLATTLFNYFTIAGLGYAIAAIPRPLSVTSGLAAFFTVCLMLGADVLVTPRQIFKTRIITGLEVIAPLRQTVMLQVTGEAAAAGELAMVRASMGITRSIDTRDSLWGILAADFIFFRVLGLAALWLLVHLDRRRTLQCSAK